VFCPSLVSSFEWSPEGGRQVRNQWERLIGTDDTLRCHAQEQIFCEGSPARDVFLLARGLVLLYSHSPDGEESAFGLRFPGQILDYCAHGLDTAYPFSARALVPSTLHRIPVPAALAKEAAGGEIGILFQRLIRLELFNTAVFIVALKTTTIADRLEHLLRLIAAGLGIVPEADGSVRVPALLRDEQLADLLGCSARQFKRIKKKIRQHGRLRVNGRTVILFPPVGT
jgi:CRP-like cAMP-binding protein